MRSKMKYRAPFIKYSCPQLTNLCQLKADKREGFISKSLWNKVTWEDGGVGGP